MLFTRQIYVAPCPTLKKMGHVSITYHDKRGTKKAKKNRQHLHKFYSFNHQEKDKTSDHTYLKNADKLENEIKNYNDFLGPT